ncbi:lactococcin 972 family bacteriocin [Serinicoccus marinus]|uniref:lactococcin 972 family bacteriocin n=1 Tax=Serinicoccus marinus TaxID=247333 RepID=UPI003CD0C961
MSALTLALALSVVGASPSNAIEVEYPNEGGEWRYGYSWQKAVSRCNHPSQCHGSTVTDPNGAESRSIQTAAGNFSEAGLWWSWNKSYYYWLC